MYPACCPQMIGIVLSVGLPSWPWQRAQRSAFSATLSASTVLAPAPNDIATMNAPAINRDKVPPRSFRTDSTEAGPKPAPLGSSPHNASRSIGREGDDAVTALEVDLDVAARTNHDVLLASE